LPGNFPENICAQYVQHILAVVITELREGENLIYAMFSGKKILSKPLADKTDTD